MFIHLCILISVYMYLLIILFVLEVLCVKLYRYNPKHLYPKLNGYGYNGQRSLKV